MSHLKSSGKNSNAYEALDTTAEEWEADAYVEPISDDDRAAIRAEIVDLDEFARLATSIDHNAKGKALLKALHIAMKKAAELGAEQKAIIFTESRRTQSYGKRTGVTAVDRLNIVAHDRFQEIVDEANKPDSPLRPQQVILDPEQLQQKTVTVVGQSQLAQKLGIKPDNPTTNTLVFPSNDPPAFPNNEEQKVAQIAWSVMRQFERQPETVPGVRFLKTPGIQAQITAEVESQYRPMQLGLEGVMEKPNIAAVVAKTAELVTEMTIDIPRIVVQPRGLRSGFKAFDLKLETLNYPPVSDELWIQHLGPGNRVELVTLGEGGSKEIRLADYIVRALMNFDDISYVDHADLLYDLALQVVAHFQKYLTEEETHKVLRCYEKPIANFIHTQMYENYWEEAAAYEVTVKGGFARLKEPIYTARGEPPLDFKQEPADKSNIGKYLFGGFQRCLYREQKFQSDTERRLAVILDREALKWIRPVRGQFFIFYKQGSEQSEYQPDFVVEAAAAFYMLESKAKNEMTDAEVLAKRDAAVEWCKHATKHTATYDGKPWKYLLIPHDVIADNMTLASFEQTYLVMSEK